jgi:LPXTG-site transpeptidase (sortase) family protein
MVNNQAYKTFNGLEKMKKGDLIYVFSEKNEYIYKVSNVKLVDATKTLVEFNTNNKMLTLSTCDNFGAKTDRYVAEAEFVSKNGR